MSLILAFEDNCENIVAIPGKERLRFGSIQLYTANALDPMRGLQIVCGNPASPLTLILKCILWLHSCSFFVSSYHVV